MLDFWGVNTCPRSAFWWCLHHPRNTGDHAICFAARIASWLWRFLGLLVVHVGSLLSEVKFQSHDPSNKTIPRIAPTSQWLNVYPTKNKSYRHMYPMCIYEYKYVCIYIYVCVRACVCVWPNMSCICSCDIVRVCQLYACTNTKSKYYGIHCPRTILENVSNNKDKWY